MSSIKSLLGKDKCPSQHDPIQLVKITNTDNLECTGEQIVGPADTTKYADDEEVREALLQVSSC